MNCDLIYNENSTAIKIETFIENVLCQLEVKCSIVKVFTVEYNISIKIKQHSFPVIRYQEIFSLSNIVYAF